MKTAMKAGDKERLETVRFALSALKTAEKEKQAKDSAATLSDDEAIAVLQKEAKRRKESIALFKEGNRDELAAKEEADLAVLQTYLPKELSKEEIATIVEKVHAADPDGTNDFSSLMREAMKELKGRADGKLVGEVIKEKLGA